jgi:apolipoprotein N-acyltransferase
MSFPTSFTRNSRLSLLFLSAVLFVLSQPPVSLFPLAYVALVPLFLALELGKNRQNFLAGFIAGTAAYTGCVYWVIVAMNTYGGISIPLAILILALLVLYMALYVGTVTWLAPLMERTLRIPLYVGAPLLWVLGEYWRGWFLTGFPWSYVGHSQSSFLTMLQVVSITGTYFLSFLIVSVNAILAHAWRWRRIPLAFTIIIGLAIALSLVYGHIRLKEKDAGTLTTTIVQGNIRQDVKWDTTFKLKTITKYSQMSLQGGQEAALTLWPETAMPFVFNVDEASSFVPALSKSLSTDLLVGTLSRDARGRFYNSAYMYGKEGQLVGMYSKVHLVPFGEFTPLRQYFPFLEKISVATGDFFSGKGHVPISTDIGKVGILICYEGVFPYITNETVRNGAQVLVNITNDAWFGRSSAPYQHLAFYLFRAVETDRYVLRAANTGVSAIIDPKGRIKSRTPIFEEAVLRGTFSLKDGQTFYVRYGDYFVLACFVVLVGLAMWGIFRKEVRGARDEEK